MPGEAGFWRNVTLIAVAHVALLITILYWRNPRSNSGVQPIVWMTGANNQATEAPLTEPPEPSTAPDDSSAATLPPEDVQQDHAITPPAKSEIELPSETPTLAPKLAEKVTPDGTPISSKPTLKPSPKRATKATKEKPSPASIARASHKPNTNRSPSKFVAKEKTTGKTAGAGKVEKPGGNSGHVGQSATAASDLNWYGDMLHDRFYREWVQPTTVVAAGAKLSALVKIRIEKDGRISDFKIIQSSGNVVVDESIASVAKRVTKVDALPVALGARDHYDVSINFELNPAQ